MNFQKKIRSYIAKVIDLNGSTAKFVIILKQLLQFFLVEMAILVHTWKNICILYFKKVSDIYT